MRQIAIRWILIILALLVLGATAVMAGDDGDIVGYWESYDYEVGEVFRVEFTEDGMFYAETWDFEMSYYVIDEENEEVGIAESGDEDAVIDWMFYTLEDDLLILEDEEALMELMYMWAPVEPAHLLDATWMILPSDEEMESEEDIEIIYITFDADGFVAIEELDDDFIGIYSIDPRHETIELTIDDDGEDSIEVGEYYVDDGFLTIVIDGDGVTFTPITMDIY